MSKILLSTVAAAALVCAAPVAFGQTSYDQYQSGKSDKNLEKSGSMNKGAEGARAERGSKALEEGRSAKNGETSRSAENGSNENLGTERGNKSELKGTERGAKGFEGKNAKGASSESMGTTAQSERNATGENSEKGKKLGTEEKSETGKQAEKGKAFENEKAEGKSGTEGKTGTEAKSGTEGKAGTNATNETSAPNSSSENYGKAETKNVEQGRNAENAVPGGMSNGKNAPQLTEVKKDRIREAVRKEDVKNITNVDFSVSVGSVVPERYDFHPLPDDIVSLVPQYRGYDFLLVNDEIVIVEPSTHRIVYTLPENGMASMGGESRSVNCR